MPCSTFVPDFVTAFTVPPECTPFSAESPLVATRNSCSASGNGNGMLRLSYGLLCEAPSRRYATPNGRLPATPVKTDPGMLLLFGVSCTAAPARTMRSVTWRPWSGSSRIRSCSTTSLMPVLRTSTSGVAASTETVSSRLPTDSSTLIVGVAATWSTMPVCT